MVARKCNNEPLLNVEGNQRASGITKKTINE